MNENLLVEREDLRLLSWSVTDSNKLVALFERTN